MSKRPKLESFRKEAALSSISSSLVNKHFSNSVERSTRRLEHSVDPNARPRRSYYSNDQSGSGFHPFLQSSQSIEFLSTFNFSDPSDGSPEKHGSDDPTPVVPVTEMSDLELRRLGFPVPATTTPESVYSILRGFSGSAHDLSSVIDSPYIKFTSRKLNERKEAEQGDLTSLGKNRPKCGPTHSFAKM
jgi:hypothetical protein